GFALDRRGRSFNGACDEPSFTLLQSRLFRCLVLLNPLLAQARFLGLGDFTCFGLGFSLLVALVLELESSLCLDSSLLCLKLRFLERYFRSLLFNLSTLDRFLFFSGSTFTLLLAGDFRFGLSDGEFFLFSLRFALSLEDLFHALASPRRLGFRKPLFSRGTRSSQGGHRSRCGSLDRGLHPLLGGRVRGLQLHFL